MNHINLKTIAFLSIFFIVSTLRAEVPESVIEEVSSVLKSRTINQDLMEKGVRQVARLWQKEDGTEEEFKLFCTKNYISSPEEKQEVFNKISNYLEILWGGFNEMNIGLKWNIHINNGPIHSIDQMFSAYSPGSHLTNDLYNNKIGFLVALNFPEIPIKDKELLDDNRQAWAYARMGDIFTSRVPSELLQARAKAGNDADIYIANYNIYTGHTLSSKNKKIFPKDQVLLSHWNLRDEIKANYGQGMEGLEKQRTIYEVMKRIISQEIPLEIVNSGEYDWNPYKNTVTKEGKAIEFQPEGNRRYQHLLNNFHAVKAIDPYSGKNYIERKFSEGMEIAVEDVKAIFHTFLSAPELKEAGKIISKRLGRKLEAYDIWYDGFKVRSSLDEAKLDIQTSTLYPNAEALEAAIPDLLIQLGFSPERAAYLGERIAVDPARGSGHAWRASKKGGKARLRTRVPEKGMNYKGYNIAIHELGHNVEQTISLYDVDNYMMNGIPNTSFTEALAFLFQKRDLQLLGIENNDPYQESMDIMDKLWGLFEIMGVSMLDISVWEWMYNNPSASSDDLKDAVIRLSKDIWNEYYAPVFGRKDETILAVYSHMIASPLYLSAYAFGQIIEFQLESYIKDKPFAKEVDRIYSLGRLTPNQWMRQATGSDLSADPLILAARQAMKQKM